MRKKILLLLGLVFLVACSSTPHKRSVGEVIDDSVISNKLKIKYLKNIHMRALKINIDTWKGVVTLKGKVKSQDQIDKAVDIAERQPGVKEVKSNLTVVRSAKKSKHVSEAPTHTVEEKSIDIPQGEAKPHFDDEPNMDQPSKINN